MTLNERNRLSGLALGAGGAALFSLKGVIMKLAFMEGGSVEQMMAYRMGIALPIFVAVGVWSYQRSEKTLTKKTFLLATGLGILSYYVCTWLDFTGLQYVSAQLERLILFLYPTITALLAWVFLKDRITRRHVAALVLSYAGVALLALQEYDDLGANVVLGSMLIFFAAVLYAGFVTAAKPVISKIGSPLFTSIAMSMASFVIIGHFAFTLPASSVSMSNPSLWMLGAILAIPCTVFPSFMIMEAIARIGPGLTSAIGGLGPAATAIFAVLILSEPFRWPQGVALTLTVGGIYLLSSVSPEPRE